VSQPTRLLDVNVLLALTNPAHLHHGRSHDWFAAVDTWATTPITQTAFIRLMLNPAVAGRPIALAEVLSLLDRLLAWPGHTFWEDDSSLAAARIDTAGLIGHRQVTDFHLVNLAARRGGRLATFDRALARALLPADQAYVEVVTTASQPAPTSPAN